eukprot:scaffold2420_cov85-Phaeocystis_antarctica.AAC.3
MAASRRIQDVSKCALANAAGSKAALPCLKDATQRNTCPGTSSEIEWFRKTLPPTVTFAIASSRSRLELVRAKRSHILLGYPASAASLSGPGQRQEASEDAVTALLDTHPAIDAAETLRFLPHQTGATTRLLDQLHLAGDRWQGGTLRLFGTCIVGRVDSALGMSVHQCQKYDRVHSVRPVWLNEIMYLGCELRAHKLACDGQCDPPAR